jgi:hypothetical protein
MMRNSLFVTAALLLCANSHAAGENKGSCPPSPPKPKAPVTSLAAPKNAPSPDATFAGTVSLLAVVSDKGYVCSVQLMRGFDKVADAQAARTVRQWHLDPARKDGHPVPVTVQIDVAFWRNAQGELVQDSRSQPPK